MGSNDSVLPTFVKKQRLSIPGPGRPAGRLKNAADYEDLPLPCIGRPSELPGGGTGRKACLVLLQELIACLVIVRHRVIGTSLCSIRLHLLHLCEQLVLSRRFLWGLSKKNDILYVIILNAGQQAINKKE